MRPPPRWYGGSVSRGATGGVSVRAGPSPSLRSRRVRARREHPRPDVDIDRVRATGALLCSECGRLEWPDQTAASPHRATDGVEQHRACPHCEARAWIDLRRESTALAIRQGEEGGAARESVWADTGRKAGIGLIIGSILGLLVTSSLWAGTLVALLSGAAVGLGALRLRRISMAPPSPLPDRWSLALPPAEPMTETHRGRPEVTETLRAPLTGRACVAYEVGLRADGDADGELSSWALLEQRVAAQTVDGCSVDPDATFARPPREYLGELSPQLLDAAGMEWLAERGFSAVGSNLRVYESIVPVDADVELSRGDAGATLALA